MIIEPNPKSINLHTDHAEDLQNLLYQLNWLNEAMKSDKSNAVISAILLSIDPANKDVMHDLLETISRVNLSDSLIKNTINLLEN